MSSVFRGVAVTVCCVIAQMPTQASGQVTDCAMEARDTVDIADVPRPHSL